VKGTAVYTKTPAGQKEILDRRLRLHPRLRSLLVLIDGRRCADELLQTLSAVGISGASLGELQQLGLIELRAAKLATAATSRDDSPRTEPADGAGQANDELYSFFTPPA
jgi:hypothetical protein